MHWISHHWFLTWRSFRGIYTHTPRSLEEGRGCACHGDTASYQIAPLACKDATLCQTLLNNPLVLLHPAYQPDLVIANQESLAWIVLVFTPFRIGIVSFNRVILHDHRAEPAGCQLGSKDVQTHRSWVMSTTAPLYDRSARAKARMVGTSRWVVTSSSSLVISNRLDVALPTKGQGACTER